MSAQHFITMPLTIVESFLFGPEWWTSQPKGSAIPSAITPAWLIKTFPPLVIYYKYKKNPTMLWPQQIVMQITTQYKQTSAGALSVYLHVWPCPSCLLVHQWMTAGQGVVHAEMPVSEEPVVGLQLWVNLPRRDKMVEPAYQELKGSEIPKPSQGGVTVAVISGEALGAKVCVCMVVYVCLVSVCLFVCVRVNVSS